ncbi:MAG: hypothetical protein LBK06_07180, partial [Planctomycetaceae bacterium]|nr:hypothetical protein [Planctomycetaceae bacterium]
RVSFMFFCNYRILRIFGGIFFVLFFVCVESYGGIGDCLWGGANEETSYTMPFVSSGTTLAQSSQPPMNIGAPIPSIPVQATPSTRATLVPQPNIPTISPITGNVGTIGQPASNSISTQFNNQIIPNNTSRVGGVEVVYVIPSGESGSDICIGGERGSPAVAAKIVAAGTPGAIPVALTTTTAYRPKVQYRLKFAPMKQKTETFVNVIDPRTRRVVRSYCQTGERQITTLPVVHWEEVIGYETVTVKIGTPIKQNYPQNYPQNYNPNPATPTPHKVLYLEQQPDTPTFSTDIY